ncbi:Acylphosphatase-like domain-containing protein, partial [Delphinella strobiligena]
LRSFTVKQAKSLGITGSVQNASDGTVTGEAQGDSNALKEFVGHLNKGPSAASVSKVDTKAISTKSGESSFS